MNGVEALDILRSSKSRKILRAAEYFRQLQEAVELDAIHFKETRVILQKTQVRLYLSARLNQRLAGMIGADFMDDADFAERLTQILDEELEALREKVPAEILDEIKAAFYASLEINGKPLSAYAQSGAV